MVIEARAGGGGASSSQFYGVGASSSSRREVEWDLNDWNWDGDLFVATPVSAACRDKQVVEVPEREFYDLNCPAASSRGEVRWGRGVEKRRRMILQEVGREIVDVDSPALQLSGREDASRDAASGDGRTNGVQSSDRGVCQVEGCGADLSAAKDYHRRHKVCEAHAKASAAIVGDTVQRFCQQCSRFHLLQEFDEGKRSCRRRLAGHNKRRRKNRETNTGEPSLNDGTVDCVLISLLRILSLFQSKSNEEVQHQDLLVDFLRSIANLIGSVDTGKLSALLQASQDQQDIRNASARILTEPSKHPTCHITYEPPLRPLVPAADGVEVPANSVEIPQCSPESTAVPGAEPILEKNGTRNFDLNDVCCDEGPNWTNVDVISSSPESLISSNEDQGRTDKIVFKLFGKDPNDFPPHLRKQIFNWLSGTPTDAESFIRPGCIILTVYLRLAEFTWEELSCNLSFHLRRLLNLAVDEFWKNGCLYVRLHHRIAFIYNGQLLLDAPLLSKSHRYCKILSISPLAVTVSGTTAFRIKGLNLAGNGMRLLCAFEGKYLVEKATNSLLDESASDVHERQQFLNISCSTPSTYGRGFIEVEDHSFSSSFFPFIVAEKDICAEVRTLESTIDVDFPENRFEEKTAELKARERALDFLHEMGWFLRTCRSISVDGNAVSNKNGFPLARFKWLVEFSIEHEWHAVAMKLLRCFFGGFVDTSGLSLENALKEITLLHYAVSRNSRTMVELLLRYVPEKSSDKSRTKNIQDFAEGFCFSPDMTDHDNVTPLHIAASIDNAEEVLDALTDDPKQVGITAWKTVRNSSGSTPADCASSSGHEPYMKLVEKKINGNSDVSHVVLDIPNEVLGTECRTYKETNEPNSRSREQMKALQMDTTGKSGAMSQSYCKMCNQQQLAFINRNRSSLLYRPAMLSMVGIATVCICISLLLRGPPNVRCILGPFRWKALDYGWI